MTIQGRENKAGLVLAQQQSRLLGFTLLELLVTIAIIATLAGLLLTATSRSKKVAQRIACTNNHRQLVLGWLQYAHEGDSELMPNVDGVDKPPSVTNWVAGDIQRPTGVDATNTALLVDRDQSLMAAFIDSPRIYKCPSDPSRWARSVSMNNRLNPVRALGVPSCTGGIGTNFMVYLKLQDIRDPSRIYVTLDERFDSINEGNFAVDMSNTGTLSGVGTVNPYYWVDTPASYHEESLMLSFADGHVEPHRWLDPATLGPLLITGIRHTSASDPNIQWMQEHATERR